MVTSRLPLAAFMILAAAACAPARSEHQAPPPAQATDTPRPTAIPPQAQNLPQYQEETDIPRRQALLAEPTPTLFPCDAPIHAVMMVPASLPDWDGVEAVLADTLPSLGANWVGLHPYCYQDTTHSLEFDCQSSSPEVLSDEDIHRMTALAHAAGLRVMLAPDPVVSRRMIDTLEYDPPRGEGWSEAKWLAWFDAYTQVTLDFAHTAQEAGVDYFVVAHELSDTTHREQDWRRLISAVREVYKGPLTYGAIEYPGMREWRHIRFWDALDAIGITTGGSLTQNPEASQQELDRAWELKAAQYTELSDEWGKPVLFVELMAHSRNGAAVSSDWRIHCGETIDQEEQAAYFKAFSRATANAPWLRGLVIWALTDNPTDGGPAEPNFTFLNKPAEAVVREMYGGEPRNVHFESFPYGAIQTSNLPGLTVYDDALRNGWSTWAGEADPAPDLLNASPAIGAASVVQPQPSSFNGVVFVAPHTIDMSDYSALEFFLRVGQVMPPDLQVQFSYWVSPGFFPTYWRVRPNDPRYIDPYPLAPDTWHHVIIPLDALGVSDKPISEFSILDQAFDGCRSDPVVVDQVRLVGPLPEGLP